MGGVSNSVSMGSEDKEAKQQRKETKDEETEDGELYHSIARVTLVNLDGSAVAIHWDTSCCWRDCPLPTG